MARPDPADINSAVRIARLQERVKGAAEGRGNIQRRIDSLQARLNSIDSRVISWEEAIDRELRKLDKTPPAAPPAAPATPSVPPGAP